ncbi:MAG: sensor histidine kinase [Verrucomicrobiales bacterium]|jgi:signal transduction histidine kinase|nr:sensor histidine kinase [Verrucomicrobiales bacterium]
MNYWLQLAVSALFLLPAVAAKPQSIVEKVTADSKLLDLSRQPLPVSSTVKRISIKFKPVTPSATRCYQIKLDGWDLDWSSLTCFMYFYVNFYDAAGNLVKHQKYPVIGRSPGWRGDFESSSFTHRRETLAVPPGADNVIVGFSSAGPPKTMGIYLINELEIWGGTADGEPRLLLRLQLSAPTQPAGWSTNGVRRDLAKILTVRDHPALALTDDDPDAHTEWHTNFHLIPAVSAGELLTLEWNEIYCIGSGDYLHATYDQLPVGNYCLRIATLDALGVIAAPDHTLSFTISTPLWQKTWFQTIAALAVILVIALTMWRVFHANAQRRLHKIKQAAALDQERLRITRDIHDDLGARLTHLSLISERAKEHAESPAMAREDFERIAGLTRRLVTTLHETIWTINPERDNLESLVTFLCQMTQSLCEPAGILCRLEIPAENQPIPLSSEMRHQICMAVREAVNNAVKHSGAREITLGVRRDGAAMEITVADRGNGLPPDAPGGNGMTNMKRRVESIGGSMELQSVTGSGTVLRFRFPLEK